VPTLDDVVSVAVHPAIGVARVGNSKDGFFVGPEVPGRHPLTGEPARDANGAFKRQAARFRLFGLDARQRVVREITARDANITWTVHVANKKAAWYDFQQAFDIPASMGEIPGVRPLASGLRNKNITGGARARLVIDPGPRTLRGNTTADQRKVRFNTGTFLETPVDLGVAQLDDEGRLTVLGGFGESRAPGEEDLVDFANNPGWCDDVSDGSIDATVEIGGRKLDAIGAWVIVGPPNFAPGIAPFVTGWDLAREVMIRKGLVDAPTRPSFGEHIQPILQRLSTAQWVNSGFALEFGWGTPADFSAAAMLARLSDPGDASRPLRQAIFAWFRNPLSKTTQADRIPAVYGDAILIDPKTTDPREWMAILETQYHWLDMWARGEFEPGLAPPPPVWEKLSPAERAVALDQAALEDCAGGPFHPGIEFTWPLRQPMLYDDKHPFRIKRRMLAEPTLPSELTSSFALAPGGPLDGSLPGDLSRWMALPWQGDTASCLSAYEDFSGEYVPTFWPARVPNDVITEKNYRTIMDGQASRELRHSAFATAQRRKWLRGVSYSDEDTSKPNMRRGGPSKFVTSWRDIGVVARRPGPTDLHTLPDEMWVETERIAPPRPPVSAVSSREEGEDAGRPSALGLRRRSRLDR
jgi:L-lysine epsilon oxidase-like protein